VCQVCQTQNQLAQPLAHLKTPINTGLFGQVCQVCQTSGTFDAQREGDPQVAPQPSQHTPTPQVAPHPTNGNSHNQLTQPVNGNQSENSAEGGEGSPQPAPHPAPQQPTHWVDVVVNVVDMVEVVDTLQTAQPPAPQPVGGVVVVTSDDWKEDESIVVVTSEDCDGSGDWQDGLLLVEAQPPTTPAEPTTPKPKPIPITDPFCMQCAERLYPDAGGIAVCVGCGKVYDVSITEAEKLKWFANKMLAVEKDESGRGW